MVIVWHPKLMIRLFYTIGKISFKTKVYYVEFVNLEGNSVKYANISRPADQP